MYINELIDETIGFKKIPTVMIIEKAKKLSKMQNELIDYHLKSKLDFVYINASSLTDILKHNGANGHCYTASMAILLAMNPDDLVVKGNLLPEHPKGWEHQWVEFKFNNNWYVLDSTFVGVYEKENYYNCFDPQIVSQKSNAEWMKDDFAKKHEQIIRIKSQSWDLNLFLYYQGKNVDKVTKDLYENIELDEKGNVKAYHTPSTWF